MCCFMCVQNCSRDKGTKGPNTVAKPLEPEPTGNNDTRTSFMLCIQNSLLTHQRKRGHIGQTCSIQRINKKNKQNCVLKTSRNKANICSCEEYVSLVLSPTRTLNCCIKCNNMWSVQKVSDLNFSRINKSSTGSVHHCRCGGDIYAHV